MSASSPSPVSSAELQAWLITHVAQYLGLPPEEVDIHTPLLDYGLDSIFSISLCGELEDWLHISVEPTLVWEYPTIDRITTFLHGVLSQARP